MSACTYLQSLSVEIEEGKQNQEQKNAGQGEQGCTPVCVFM